MQPNNPLETRPQVMPSDIVASNTQSTMDGQMPAKRARRVNVLYSGMFLEKH
jgi:hypothetical protein